MTEEEIVARAIDPAEWREFDAYVRRLGLDGAEQAAARQHRHGPIRPSLRRARAAIAALDEFRRDKAGPTNQASPR
jgi:hypothetical protein